MTIRDRIYGSVQVNESYFVELINSQPIQRLKGISQYGLPDEYYHLKGFSRFEHSVGVMLLLRKFRASQLEQIAGLLHDTSHTAFSHTVDWVIGDTKNEGLQDSLLRDFIEKGKIAKILRTHGIDPKSLSNLHNFTLLEKARPNLCADRIDYFLREPGVPYKKILSGLTVNKYEFICKDKNAARTIANAFLERQVNSWAGYQASFRWYFFTQTLKYALKKKVINMQDFFQDDHYVLEKLIASKDQRILSDLNILREKDRAKLPKVGAIVKKKIRYLNPKFVGEDGKVKKLSSQDPIFKKKLAQALKKLKIGIEI